MPIDESLLEPVAGFDESLLEPVEPENQPGLTAIPQDELDVGPFKIPIPSWMNEGRRLLFGPNEAERAVLEQRVLPEPSTIEKEGVIGAATKPLATIPRLPHFQGVVPGSGAGALPLSVAWNALVAPAVESVLSPGGVATAGSLSLARRLALQGSTRAARALMSVPAATFGAPAAVAVPEVARHAGTTSVTGTPGEKGEAYVALGGSVAVPAAIGFGTARPSAIPPMELEQLRKWGIERGMSWEQLSDLYRFRRARPVTVTPPEGAPPAPTAIVPRGTPPPRPPRPVVPGTPAEPYQTALGEIRTANARTIADIQRLFPRANLSREQARALRDQAFPPIRGEAVTVRQPPEEPPAAPTPVPVSPVPPAPPAPASAIPPQDAPLAPTGQSVPPVPETPAVEAPAAEISATGEPPLVIPALGMTEADLSLPKIRALPMNNPALWARMQKYFGVRTVPEMQAKVKARFDAMREAGGERAPEPVAPTSIESAPLQPASVVPAPPAKKARVGPVGERPTDLIDIIEAKVGKIRSKSGMQPGEEGYYGALYKELSRSGARRVLSPDGQSWDSALEFLRREGDLPEETSVDTFQEKLLGASRGRGAFRKGQTSEQRQLANQIAEQEEFDAATYTPREGATPINVNEVIEGESLDMLGTNFKVKELVWDEETLELAYVVLEDGRKFGVKTVGADSVIYADEGTYQQKEPSTEFVPPEEQAKPDPFALEQLSDEQVKAEEAAKAERARKAKEREKLEEGAAAPLVGDSTDVGQAKLFDADVDLFSGPSAESAGPGAASPIEFHLRNAKRESQLTPPPVPPTKKPPGTEGALPDDVDIRNAVRERDVLPSRDIWSSMEFIARKHPKALRHVRNLIEGELKYRADVARANEALMDRQLEQLTDAENVQLATVMRQMMRGDHEALDTLSPGARRAWEAVRDYLNVTKERVIAKKQSDLLRAMPPSRRDALEEILAGGSVEPTIKKHKLTKAGREDVLDALAELQDIRRWGIENYITNIEAGTYRIVDPDGVTVAIGETRAEARAKAIEYAQKHPDVESLTIDNSFNPGVDFPTQLTRNQYERMVRRMAEELDTTAKSIREGLRREGYPIVAVKPTNKFAGPMLRRRNILEGEKDLRDSLPAYIHAMEKKLTLDPILEEVREGVGDLPKNLQKQVLELAQDVKGRYHLSDQIVDHLLAPLGLKPMAASRTADAVRTVETALKLGYRPVSAIINRAGGIQHTWVKTGTKLWVEAKRFQKTPAFKEIWERNKDYVGWESTLASVEGTAHPMGKLWQPLGMFQLAERANRPEAFAAFYLQALKHGKRGAEAEADARSMVRTAQFVYNTAALPRMMRGPVGRVAFQFKPYLVKEAEFISTLRGAEIPRYIASFLALGGPRALIIMMKSLPILGSIGALSTLEDWLNKMPAFSRGIPGGLGVDIAAAVAPQLPSNVEDWFGVATSDLFKLWRDVLKPAMQGKDRDWRDVADWGIKLAPLFMYLDRMVDSLSKGVIEDKRGRKLYTPTSADKVKYAFGAKPLEQSRQEVETRYLDEQDAIKKENRQRAIDAFLDALQAEDGAAMQRGLETLQKYGVSSDSVKEALRQRGRGPYDRLQRRLLKSTRAEEAERFEGRE